MCVHERGHAARRTGTLLAYEYAPACIGTPPYRYTARCTDTLACIHTPARVRVRAAYRYAPRRTVRVRVWIRPRGVLIHELYRHADDRTHTPMCMDTPTSVCIPPAYRYAAQHISTLSVRIRCRAYAYPPRTDTLAAYQHPETLSISSRLDFETSGLSQTHFLQGFA